MFGGCYQDGHRKREERRVENNKYINKCWLISQTLTWLCCHPPEYHSYEQDKKWSRLETNKLVTIDVKMSTDTEKKSATACVNSSIAKNKTTAVFTAEWLAAFSCVFV